MACYFLKISLYLFPRDVAITGIPEVRTKKRLNIEIKIFTSRGQRDGPAVQGIATLAEESYLVPNTSVGAHNCL